MSILMNEVRGELFLRRLPPEIRNGLDPAQEAAIRAAAGGAGAPHRIDIRFTLPTLRGGYYVVILAGPERRNAARREQDRQARPLIRSGAGPTRRVRTVCLGGLLLLAGLLLYGTLIEF